MKVLKNAKTSPILRYIKMLHETIFLLLGVPIGLFFSRYLTDLQMYLLGFCLLILVFVAGAAGMQLRKRTSFPKDTQLKDALIVCKDRTRPVRVRFIAAVCAGAMMAGSLIAGAMLGLIFFYSRKGG